MANDYDESRKRVNRIIDKIVAKAQAAGQDLGTLPDLNPQQAEVEMTALKADAELRLASSSITDVIAQAVLNAHKAYHEMGDEISIALYLSVKRLQPDPSHENGETALATWLLRMKQITGGVEEFLGIGQRLCDTAAMLEAGKPIPGIDGGDPEATPVSELSETALSDSVLRLARQNKSGNA